MALLLFCITPAVASYQSEAVEIHREAIYGGIAAERELGQRLSNAAQAASSRT